LDTRELAALHPSEQRRLIDHAADVLRSAGAHYLIGSIAELPPVLDSIEISLALGEKP
jgi:phosphonoacetaldehyde hydrolase